MICTRCDGTGFINWDDRAPDGLSAPVTALWLIYNQDTDMQVCDCCGDGHEWYGEPGSHYSSDDPPGPHGPYVYNGGLCECH